MNSIIKSYSSLIDNTNYKTSILSNTSSFLNMILEDINWVGFYLFIDNSLILGPFQGNTACTVISLDKGVCGAAARTLSTQRVENVHEFPGHIACDSRSNSEIVIPIIIDDNLFGVLDIDSPSYSRFTEFDQVFLEEIVKVLINRLKQVKSIL